MSMAALEYLKAFDNKGVTSLLHLLLLSLTMVVERTSRCAALCRRRLSFARFAQRDLAGEWGALYHEDQPHRIPGPELGDYTGLPINDAGRLKADSWDASILTLREHQAKPHPSTYSLRGPANIRIRRELDPVTQQTIGYELFGTFGQATRMLWLDGRPHPPAHAAHTWAGFSTARWDGDALTVFTTHLKAGWLQRNGVAHSDQATMTERFIRHGNVLTVVSIVDDPIYLEEPFIRTTNWVLNPGMEIRRTQFDVVDEVAGRQKGDVPHHLPGSPGALQKLKEFASHVGLPPAAARGGAATMYPEYQRTMNVARHVLVHGCRPCNGWLAPTARAETDNTLRVAARAGQGPHDRWRRRQHCRAGRR